MSQSQLTFEDLPTQTSESFHPSKQPKGYHGLSPRHFEQGGGTLTLQHEILSKQDPYNSQENTSTAPKQTGNTPRFGAGKKIGPLKPLNPRPNELIAVNSNDNSLSDSSPITKSKLANESHFRSQQEVDYSPANRSLSPSNQGKFDINSVGNSPRKKANALKHPLINKKSPLFKKFGMENFSLGAGYQGTFQTAADNYEAYLLEKKSLKAPIDTEKMNIRNRANLTQMIEKHNEVKKVQTNATESTSYTTNSSSNIVTENFATKNYSSEYAVHSEAGVVTKSNTKENHPQVNRNLKVPKIPTKSSFKNGSTNSVAESNRIKSGVIGEANSFCEGENQHSHEYRRKKYGHPKNTIPNKTSSGGNLKEGLHNDSITSLELSAIVNDINEKDPLNLSKDEILLQYIDEQDAPLRIKKQITSEMTNTEDNNNILRNSSSASNMENLIQQQEQSSKPQCLIPLEEAANNKQQAINAKNSSSHSRGRRMLVKSFISEEGGGGAYTENFEADSRIYANHDRNSSMYEISDQYSKEDYLVSQAARKLVPEKFKQRRVESALPRGTNSYAMMDNSPSTNMHWKEKATLQVKQQRLPNTEKSNVKHFHFLGSPNLGFLQNQENIKKRLYVNMKPGTSSALNRSNLKKERPSLPHRISNPKNKFAFQSVGPYYPNLNDSGLGLGFDDSIDAGSGFNNSNKKSDLGAGNFGRFGDLSPILPDENNVLKLKEEIKKLQAKDQEAQVKIAKLHIQMETQNKEWEKKVESIDQIWKQRLNQQREYYEKVLGGGSLQKKI